MAAGGEAAAPAMGNRYLYQPLITETRNDGQEKEAHV